MVFLTLQLLRVCECVVCFLFVFCSFVLVPKFFETSYVPKCSQQFLFKNSSQQFVLVPELFANILCCEMFTTYLIPESYITVCSCFRIVRNRAADRARSTSPSSQASPTMGSDNPGMSQGPPSPNSDLGQRSGYSISDIIKPPNTGKRKGESDSKFSQGQV